MVRIKEKIENIYESFFKVKYANFHITCDIKSLVMHTIHPGIYINLKQANSLENA